MSGEERKVEFLGGASIDGAPITYIVVLAAVVTVLAFIPLSVVLATGGSFPLSQAVYGLVGWILGPIAGAVASGVGRVIGVFLAPHTAGGVPIVTVIAGMYASFAAGCMVIGGKRKNWWIYVVVISAIAWVIMGARTVFVNGASVGSYLGGSLMMWAGILLYALPTRLILAKWINGANLGKVALGLFFGTFVTFALAHVVSSSITYWMFNWPEEVWIMLIPIVPFEYLMRAIVGTVIGTGVIAGLRAIGMVKPENALY